MAGHGTTGFADEGVDCVEEIFGDDRVCGVVAFPADLRHPSRLCEGLYPRGRSRHAAAIARTGCAQGDGADRRQAAATASF